MRMSGIELQSYTAGRWHGAPPSVINGVTTDTRSLKRGDAFLALRGPNFDGHAFAAEAAAKGAAALIGDAAGVQDWHGIGVPQLQVADSLQAFGDIAAAWRTTLKMPVVAITGSFGKTTLRSMLEHVLLGKGLRLTATRSNDNNLIGVPQTLLRIRQDDDVAIVECGISEPGEMRRLAAMIRPDVAVITGIATAHAEGLGSLAGVAAEKAILLDMLAEGGCAVLGHGVAGAIGKWTLPAGCALLDMDASDGGTVQWEMHGQRVDLKQGNQDVSFDLELPAVHWAQDAALSATILLCLGLATLEEVGEAMGQWQAVGGRMRMIAGTGGCTLLDDSYNANPASMLAALDTLRRLPGRRIAVLGDMAELGKDSSRLHAGLDVSGLDAVLLVGDEMRSLAAVQSGAEHLGSMGEVVDRLFSMQPGSGDTVLIKGSRCMHMERVVDALAESGDAV